MTLIRYPPSSVYNHVLRLDLSSFQWSLVDNYGDIPGVRMGMSDPEAFQLCSFT